MSWVLSLFGVSRQENKNQEHFFKLIVLINNGSSIYMTHSITLLFWQKTIKILLHNKFA